MLYKDLKDSRDLREGKYRVSPVKLRALQLRAVFPQLLKLLAKRLRFAAEVFDEFGLGAHHLVVRERDLRSQRASAFIRPMPW